MVDFDLITQEYINYATRLQWATESLSSEILCRVIRCTVGCERCPYNKDSKCTAPCNFFDSLRLDMMFDIFIFLMIEG